MIDDKLYLMLHLGEDENSNLKGIYYLNDKNRFEIIKVKVEGTGDNVKRRMDSGLDFSDFLTLCNIIGDPFNFDDEDGWRYWHEKYNRYKEQALFLNHVRGTDVSEFAEVVNELSGYKIKNQVDLQVAYGNILKEFGLSNAEMYNDSFLTGYPVVGTMKTEYGYYLVRTSGNAELIKVNDKNGLYKALKSADGRKVTRIECIKGADVPENLKIPEGITYVSGFWEQEELKSVELPDTVKEIGKRAFYDCINLQNIQLPDSVEKIGSYAFKGCTGLQQIELPDFIREIGEDAFEVVDGLSPVIIASEGSYVQQYAEKNNLDCAEKKLSKAEIEERELIGEALKSYQNYVDNWDNETELLGMALAYINADNIPECILWARIDSVYYSDNNILLSYTADGMIEEELGFSQFGYEGIKYSSKAGKICREYWVNGAGDNYTIYSFDKELATFAEINDFMAAEEPEYTVNGENYGSHEAIEEYISSLGIVNFFSEEDVCDNIREAYNKLKKVN
ncbi:MAG: leucine-rich repeat domain-containing protein [Dorea sp.]|nr:leucine-rich repeat domain-containing protein [Dorea sp.]